MAPSFDNEVPTSPIRPSKHATPHPFAPLSGAEITNTASIIRKSWPEGTDLQFRVITLREPDKSTVIPFLDAENKGESYSTPLARKAFVVYYLRNTSKLHEAVVDLSEQKVEYNVRLGPNVHANLDGETILSAEKIALSDEGVKAALKKLQLPEGAVVVCDPWIYGSDGIKDDDLLIQCFLYMRNVDNSENEDSNHYAHPLPISPVVDVETGKVIRIDYMPTGVDNTIKEPGLWPIRPGNEYISSAQTLRTDLKPLRVVQPEGASFTVTEQGTSRVLEWQKWSFRVGFNQREGMVLHNVRYDNRSLFYRLSLSDMNIPYADPRQPFCRKSAFDLGDAGAGIMANNLALGCDCLGSIHYLSFDLSSDKGEPMNMPNVVCIHEQDGGIGWKHTNYRTGRASVVRNRELVLQSIITVANYEYILMFVFNQAGELHYEVRATGILSTQPIDEGIDVPFGTVVHPGVLAPHHQHIFSLRIDPMLDGHSNRLVYSEAHAMPRSADWNPGGTGYTVSETLLTHSGGYDLNTDTNRTFKIQNASTLNPINNKPVAYKIMAPPFQKILSDKDSFNHKRAEFSDRNIYAVKYHDHELFAGGLYTNQSRGGTGVRSWAEREEAIVDEDLVVFVQFGINHVPRVEDFPVMPCEVIRVGLKPVNFFERNPAIDVPPSEQMVNQSVELSARHRQGGVEGVVEGGEGEVCCKNGNGNGVHD